jgi:hypothetical protein
VGLYGEQVLPRITNVACGPKNVHPLRRRVCDPLEGSVVEIGLLAPDEGVRRWQHRLEPRQKRVFGGCHLTRPIAELLTTAGLTITDLDVFYEDGAPKFLAAESLSVAVSP